MARQTNFGGGELAPLFQGRTDLPVYARALKKMRNFFPSKHGAAVSRPGSLFINTAKNPNDSEARLIPFVFSDGQSYALEFGEEYIRFHTDGGTLQNNILATAYEKTTQYQTAHLRGIKYSQVGDVLTLTRNGYAAMELKRLPDWSLTELQAMQTDAEAEALFASAQSSLNTGGNPDPVVVKAAFRRVFIAADEGAAEAAALAFGEAAYLAWITAHPLDVPGALTQFQISYYNAWEAALLDTPHWTFLPMSFVRPSPYFGGAAGNYPCIDSAHLPVEDVTHPDRVWKYAVTVTGKDRATGRQFESLPYFITDMWDRNAANFPVALADDLHSVYPDAHLIIYRGAHKDRAGATPPVVDLSFQELGWNIYKGHDNRVMGLIGTAQGDTFVDVGLEPDYAQQPPMGTNPMLTYDYAGVLAQVETPAASCIFEDRRFLGGTQLRPMALFGSAQGDFNNFDLHDLVHAPGESILFELASLRGEKLVHLVPGRQMFVGTESNWRYFRGANGPVDYNSVDSNIVLGIGTRDVVPLVIDEEMLFVRTKGSGVVGLKTDAGENARGIDCSTHADHLLRGKGTYFPTLGFKKTLIDWTFAEDPWGVVWGVREDGMLLSLTYKGDGQAGWAWHDSYTTDDIPAQYKSVCAIPEGDEDAVYMLVRRHLAIATPVAQGGSPTASLPDPQGWVLCVERMTSRVRNNDAEDDACVDCGLRFEGLATVTIGNLAHLVGERVWFVSKGNAPMGPLLVSPAGEITLPDMPVENDGANVVGFVGLRYVPELETLNVAADGQRLRQKAVRALGLELEQSSGILVGRTFGDDTTMLETQPHTVSSGYAQPDPQTELVTAELDNSWDDGARICIRQSKPLPVTVTAIIRDLDVGG